MEASEDFIDARLLSREDTHGPKKRVRGTGDYNTQKPSFVVTATSPDRFPASMFEQMCLVSKGSIVDGLYFKHHVDGISVMSEEGDGSGDHGYVSVTSFHSWTGEVADVVTSSASFFIGLYSHLTFCSVTVAILAKEDIEDHSIIAWLSAAMLTVGCVGYLVNLIFAWRSASFEFNMRKAQGEIISSCDLQTDEMANRWALWLPFLQMVVMNLAGVSMKVRSVPTLLHNRKVGGDRVFSARLGGARIMGVSWGSKHMCQEFKEPVSLTSNFFSLVLNVAMNILKGLTVWYSNAGFGVFTLVNVAIPFAFDLITLRRILQRYLVRRGLWQLLKKNLATSDAQFRCITRHLIKKHFGVEVAAESWERSPLVGGDEYSNPETIARRLEIGLEDIQHEMALLERSHKLCRGEAGKLLLSTRHRLREASFPCFFEVASPSQIVALGMFPRSLGPFVTTKVELAPEFVLDGGKPVAWRKAPSDNDATELHLSPVSPVTLGPAEKKAAGIPEEAVWLAWSYGGNETQHADKPLLSQLCRAGGYMYFDKDFRLMHALAVSSHKQHDASSGGGMLGFRKPIGVDAIGPVGKHLEAAKRDSLGWPVLSSGVINEEFRSLRMVWVPSSDFDREVPCHGGFLFYYPDSEDPATPRMP